MTRLFLVCLTLATAATASAANTSCPTVFPKSGVKASAETSWRTGITHSTEIGTVAKTSAAREAWLKSARESMEKFLFEQTDTPEMVFAAAEGVISKAPSVALTNKTRNTIPLNYTTNAKDQGFHYDQVPRIRVSGLGRSGVLEGTLLLPVSGHTGIPNAKSWSKTDTYSIFLEDSNGGQTALARDAKSLDLTTAQEISVKLTPGKVVSLTYHRSGSGGPGGYPDGRILEIEWDGK